MNNFLIKTLGCKTNQIESALMAEKMISAGYEEVRDIKDADFYILNSCSVTAIADSKNLSYIRRVKRENPNIKTIVTGCMAQLERENLLKNDLIDYVIGNNEKNDIAEIIKSGQKLKVSDIFSHNNFRYEKIHEPFRTRASIKIQDGCNNRCSYCTIPFARGKNRSNSLKNILEQIQIFVEEGYQEIVLTGIHIGQWGEDFSSPLSLQNLLEEIEKTSVKRYRLGSLNPLELNKNFIDFLSSSNKFCPHFHLSLQSLCNKTLRNMKRFYSEEQIFNLVDYINIKFDKAFLGSDIIVGFPGETEEDFEITKHNIEKLNLSRIHVFPYSRRKGTEADLLPYQTESEVKKMRSTVIQDISKKKLNNFLNQNIGTENEVIIEKRRDKKTNLLKGVTKNYINVLIDADDSFKDTLKKVRLISVYDEAQMKAEII